MNQWCVWTHLRLGAYLLILRRTKGWKQGANRTKNQSTDCSFLALPLCVGMWCSYSECVRVCVYVCAFVCVCGDDFPTAPRSEVNQAQRSPKSHTNTHTCTPACTHTITHTHPDMEVMQRRLSGNVKHDITWNASVWNGLYSKFQLLSVIPVLR